MVSSALVDAFFQFGDVVGWDFALFVTFAYELFWPDRFHWKKSTKLKKMLREPSPGVVAALEAVYKQDDDLSRKQLVEKLNGDTPRAWDFEVSAKEISERPGGD